MIRAGLECWWCYGGYAAWVWLVCFCIYGSDDCVVCVALIGLVWALRGGWRGVVVLGFLVLRLWGLSFVRRFPR